MDNENEFIDPQDNAEKKEEGISSDLIRGHINTIILRTLATGDKYGYEIIDEIESKSQGHYTIKQPTLYSALKRLESQGFVTSYWGGSSGGGRRRYFQITEEGTAFYIKNQEEWMYSRSIIDSLISEEPETPPEAPQEEADETPVQAPKAEEPSEQTPQEAYENEESEEISEEELDSPEEEAYDAPEEEDETPTEEQPVENNSLSVLREQANEEPEPDSPYEERRESSAGAYKDVIGKLYNNAIDTAEVTQKSEKKNLPKAEPQQISGNIEFFNILERAEYDGIRVKTSGMYKPKETVEETVPTAFFNRGKAMFFSSLATFSFLLVEFVIILATRKATELSLGYPLTVLALSVVMVAVFTALYLLGFGKNAILNKNMSFLIFSFIAFGVAILLIVAFAISSQAALSEPKELVKYIVFPAVIASNIVVFACFYRFFRKRT